MNALDLEFEKLEISEAVGLPFHRFDFVVGAFEPSRRNGIFVVSQNAATVLGQGSSEFHQHANAGVLGAKNPIVQEGFCQIAISPRPEFP